MNNQIKEILKNDVHSICDYFNSDKILEELIIVVQEKINKDVINSIVNSLLTEDSSIVLHKVISCLIMVDWRSNLENKLPFRDINALGHYLDVRRNNQLSLFHEESTKSEVLYDGIDGIVDLLAIQMRTKIEKKNNEIITKEQLNKNKKYISEIIVSQPRNTISYLGGYIYVLLILFDRMSNDKKNSQALDFVNKIFTLEASLFLFKLINDNEEGLLNMKSTAYAEQHLFWIEQKNRIASQEAIEIDQLVKQKIETLKKDKKKKERAIFLQHAFDKYDDLYKALS